MVLGQQHGELRGRQSLLGVGLHGDSRLRDAPRGDQDGELLGLLRHGGQRRGVGVGSLRPGLSPDAHGSGHRPLRALVGLLAWRARRLLRFAPVGLLRGEPFVLPSGERR